MHGEWARRRLRELQLEEEAMKVQVKRRTR
jgi:hypothetical protein